MNNKGLTIIEVLMAMVICGMTLLAATTMIIMTIKLNTTGNMQTMAINYSRDSIEECVAIGARNLVSGIYEDKPHPALTRRITISDSNTETMKHVVVAVYFRKKRIIVNANVGIHNGENWDNADWESIKDQYHINDLN